jgi:hypothetical protein
MREMSDVESGKEGRWDDSRVETFSLCSDILISRRPCCSRPVLRYSNETGYVHDIKRRRSANTLSSLLALRLDRYKVDTRPV